MGGTSEVIDIRRRTADDMKSSIAALAQVHGSDGYPVNWPADPSRWLTPSGLLDAWVAVAVESEAGRTVERVVGHVVVQDGAAVGPPPIEPIGTPPERLLYVARLFVPPAARGRGVAARLLDECGRYAAAHRRHLVLDVADDGRAAIRLYERAGWRRVASTRADWLATNGERALVHHYASPTDSTRVIW